MIKGFIIQQQQQQVVEENMSNLTSAASGDQASVSSNNQQQSSFVSPSSNQAVKKKRNLPGNPDPEAEVIALSPKTLMATNRFMCEICNKGFQRDQNLQLHRRGHNLPWKLKQRTSKEIRKKVYICPEVSCVHHDPSRALGDLTGIKKHFSRKHGEKKWKCDKCSKKYAVQSDWKAHSKICGTREYRCDCGTLFSRRDSFITHRAFCDALAEESARAITANPLANHHHPPLFFSHHHHHQPPPAALTLDSQSPLFTAPVAQFPQLMMMRGGGAADGLQELSSLKTENHNQQQQHDFSLRPDIPPWLACHQQGPTSLSHLDLPSSIYSNDFSNQQDLNPSHPPHHQQPPPQPLPPPPPSAASSPHMSATALLQKAAQMGATMSRPGHAHMAPTHHSATNNTSSASNANAVFGLGLHQEMMLGSLPSTSGFNGSFDVESFGGMLGGSSKGEESLGRGGGGGEGKEEGGNISNNGGGNEGMTRDFLGLRALSHRDMLINMAGLDQCMSSTTSYELQTQQNKRPWN